MTTPLWTAKDAGAATNAATTGKPWIASGVSIDTRSLQPGDLFVALNNIRDGHDFVQNAFEAGAAAAIVSRIPKHCDPDLCLLVDDVQTALNNLARAARARTRAQVIAITGSVGKTSTKEMLRTALSPQGKTHANIASYNNHWGVPLTLARMPASADYAIIEMGMNTPGEIAQLTRLAAPNVVIVTTVGPAHLAAFESVDAIAREKASICEGLTQNGTAILNADLPQSDILYAAAHANKARIIRFGTSDQAQYHLNTAKHSENGLMVSATVNGKDICLTICAQGQHFCINALAALAACDAIGADTGKSIANLAKWRTPAGRGKRDMVYLPSHNNGAAEPAELIDDAYNANPVSMGAALAVLGQSGAHMITATDHRPPRRRVAILGDMVELGEGSAAFHSNLAHLPAIEAIDTVHCIGPLMKHLHTALPKSKQGLHVDTAQMFIPHLSKCLKPGDIVLVKASLATGLGQIVDAIRAFGTDHQQKTPQGSRKD